MVLHKGWVAAALEYGQAPLYFWPGGSAARAVVAAAGGDGTALLAAGFFVIPGGAGESPRQPLTPEEAAAETGLRGY